MPWGERVFLTTVDRNQRKKGGSWGGNHAFFSGAGKFFAARINEVMTPELKRTILSIKNDRPERLNSDMTMDSVRVIKLDSIQPVSRYSGRMTIVINPDQLPEPYPTSPEKMIGLHVCQYNALK